MRSVERRQLRFTTIDEALLDAAQLVDADRAGRLSRVGNWTLGQTLGHLATWARFAFDGYPDAIRAPLFVRIVLRMLKRRILSRGMTAGVRIGRIPGGTVGLEVVSAEEGLQQFQTALTRLHSECPSVVNPVFGALTHQEWIQLNLRHAELHLSFLIPR